MSYRCELCKILVIGPRAHPQGQMVGRSRTTHVVHKPDGNISREVPVCVDCKAALDRGRTIQQLAQRYQQTKLDLSDLAEQLEHGPPQQPAQPDRYQKVDLGQATVTDHGKIVVPQKRRAR